MTTIKEIRKNKTECDFNKWKSAYSLRACLNFDNCVGCGAYAEKQRIEEERTMRDIRFRAKRKDNNQWIYGYLYVDSFGLGEISYFIINFQTTDIFPGKIPEGMMPVHPETLGQLIGVKDKNKKDAFEGDRARYKDHSGKEQIGVITYMDYKYVLIADGGDNEGNQDLELHPDEEFEIIGNIHNMEKEEKE